MSEQNQTQELVEEIHNVIEEIGAGMDLVAVIGILEVVKVMLINTARMNGNDYYN